MRLIFFTSEGNLFIYLFIFRYRKNRFYWNCVSWKWESSLKRGYYEIPIAGLCVNDRWLMQRDTFWYHLLSSEDAGFTSGYFGKSKVRIYIWIVLANTMLAFSKTLLKLYCYAYLVNKVKEFFLLCCHSCFSLKSLKREKWGQIVPSCQASFLIFSFLVIQWIERAEYLFWCKKQQNSWVIFLGI